MSTVKEHSQTPVQQFSGSGASTGFKTAIVHSSSMMRHPRLPAEAQPGGAAAYLDPTISGNDDKGDTMRLLNTATLKLEEFGSELLTPKYAILSRRWEDDKVPHKERLKQRKTSGRGYDKIVAACAFARARGYRHLWIDMCCIDKRSSAELSEAINSMFKGYQQSDECFSCFSNVRYRRAIQDLPRSAWFTPGWTLQELIAPDNVTFLLPGAGSGWGED